MRFKASFPGLLAAFAAGLALTPQWLPAAEKAEAATSKVEPQGIRRTNVEVLVLSVRDFNVTATYVGDLQPNDRAVIKSEAEGLIEKLSFDESDPVKKGQVLANVATEQALVRRDQAKVNLELAEASHARTQSLFERQLVPPQSLDDARTALEVARLNLRAMEIELRKTTIIAPFAGVAKSRPVTQGEFAQKGTVIAELLDLSQVIAKINVPEREILNFGEGMPVTMWLDALPGRTYPGRVKTIGPEADIRSRNFPVEVAVDNTSRQFRPGMLVRVKAELLSARRQIVIPRGAVIEREQGRVVMVEEQGTARVRPVQLGTPIGDMVQVVSGLVEGDRVIVTGHKTLAAGEPVRVQRASRQPATPVE
jgi:membrane fusion protein (multidrug efflux system)